MSRRPLFLALCLVLPLLAPAGQASAADLMETYEMARLSDPELSAAEATRLAIREGAVQARSALLPQIDGTASLSRSRTTSTGSSTQFDPDTGRPVLVPSVEREVENTTRNYGVNVQQMIYDRGSFTRLRNQRALSRAADFQLESAGDSLITRTSAAYFNVLVALETLAAAQAQETALRKQFDFADKRLEVGLAPITDVYEARAQYDGARANTITTRNALEDAYQALVALTGEEIRILKALPEDFQPALPSQQLAEAWVLSAVQNNPSLLAQRYQVEAAEANIATARAGHLPTLYLSGGYGDQASWTDVTFGGTNFPAESQGRGPNLGLTLRVPIYSGGFVQSQVRQAIAQRDAAAFELEDQKRALVRNTRNAYQTLVAGISEVEALKSAVLSARSAYEASQVGLEVGTRTVLDVLNNQQTLFNAQREYALARYNFLQNRLLLGQAAGTVDAATVQEVNRLLTVDAVPPEPLVAP